VARQKLGQHFLVKGSILERIATAACPSPGETVIEIGPGRGALTEKLLGRAARVIAIELDPYLAEHLRGKFAGEPRLEIVEADALEIGYPSDYSHCLLSVEGVGAQVRFDGAELAMVFPKNGSPAALLDGFLAVRAAFALTKSKVLGGLIA